MACTRKVEREAKKARLLTKRQKEPNMTCQELADYFALSLRTVKQWVSDAGMGQSRTEDRRGVEETVPPLQRNVVRASEPGSPAHPAHDEGVSLGSGRAFVPFRRGGNRWEE